MSISEGEPTILRLPNELLIEIIDYVPERWSLSLVCKRFYDVVCTIENGLQKISLYDEKALLDATTFHSIINSRRSFDAIKINITTRMTSLCWERLTRIINNWAINHITVSSCDPRQASHDKLVDVLSTLAGDSLHELVLSNISIEHLQRFLGQQQALQNLSVTGEVLKPEFISIVKLKHLKLVGPKSKRLTEVIRRQPDLISFKLAIDEETDYNNEVLGAIAWLEKLEVLDIPLNDGISSSSVANLSRLRSLTKLSVSCSELCFQKLIVTRLESLTELDVTLKEPCFSNSIKLLAASTPHLKSIKFRGPLVMNFLIDFIECFADLESLWIENDESYYVNFTNLRPVELSNFKLKHLFLTNHDRKVVLCANDLVRFVKVFKHLETLVIRKLIDIHLNNLEFMLKSLPSLREIAINSRYIDSTTNVMNIIGVHGLNLKFIKLENFKLQSDIESLKTFFGGKFLIVEKENSHLILQKHERSFLRKIICD